jgi:hypothetical protein
MAQKVRNSGSAPMYALIKAFNALRVGLVSTNPHVDVTSKDTSADFANPSTTPDVPSTVADPTTTAGVIALHNECIDIYGRHLADAVAHKAVDATNVYTTKIAVGTVDGSGVYTPLNAFKAKFNLHLAQSGVHYTDDTTYAIATADATTLATSKALAGAIATKLKAHILFAVAGDSITLVGP